MPQERPRFMAVQDVVSIMTGRVRDEPRAMDVVRALAGMRSQGLIDRILFSTWRGELAPYPDLERELDTHAIEIIQMPAPAASLQESHQKLPMLAALNFVDARSFVTRHRFDRLFPDQVFASYLAFIRQHGPEEITLPHAPFRHRVTVNSALVDVPFFFGDFMFSGFRDDVAAIVDINAHAELFRADALNPEMTFFAAPFLHQFPEIADYFATYPGLSYGRPEFDRALRAARQGSAFYLDLFALHVHVATSHFSIGYRTDAAAPGQAKVDIDALLFRSGELAVSPGTFYFPLAGHLATKRGHLFEQIAAGHVVKSAASDHVVARLAALRGPGKAPRSLAGQIAARFAAPRPDTPPPHPFRMRVLGEDARVYADNLVAQGLPDVPRFGAVTRNGRVTDYHVAQLAPTHSPLVRANGSTDMNEWGVL